MLKSSDIFAVKNNRLAGRYSKERPSMGRFVEDYIKGDVDLLIDFRELMKIKDDVFKYKFDAHHYRFFFGRFLPEVAIHSKKQDERIVRSHYDNRNDLFAWFLGPRMVYTSAYFNQGHEDLETAQDEKIRLIAKKVQLQEGHKVLDIGCGWGTMVMQLAKLWGANSTGITIAQSGADFGNEQIRQNGVEGKAKILRMDYRDIPAAKYDRITCLEMAEHVGVKNFRKFMKQIYGLLEDDGIFYLQIAGLRARTGAMSGFYMEDLVWGLFMNKYIFSGADASMPLSYVVKNMERAGFEIHSVENVGIHYAKTIDAWYDYWRGNYDKVMERFGQSMYRTYEVFLAWSVKIAEQGSSTCFQIVCNKNTNNFNRNRWINSVALGETASMVEQHQSSETF